MGGWVLTVVTFACEVMLPTVPLTAAGAAEPELTLGAHTQTDRRGEKELTRIN